MKYHGSIELTLTIQNATSQLVCRLDMAEFKAKCRGMTFALSLTNRDKRNFTFC